MGYTYEIIAVNEAARCMEIVYTSDDGRVQHVGARLPYLGEDVASIVAMYSPEAYWREQDAEVVIPTVGTAGVSQPEIAMSLADIVRQQRDNLLASSDWTQVADAPVDQTAWATYRQALRDLPQQEGFPESVTWPEQPA